MRPLATHGPQRERDPGDADPSEDRHGAAGQHGRQDQLEQGHGITEALLERTEGAVPTRNHESDALSG
jgi:hypothetical protein